jgi:hypothetical protein
VVIRPTSQHYLSQSKISLLCVTLLPLNEINYLCLRLRVFCVFVLTTTRRQSSLPWSSYVPKLPKVYLQKPRVTGGLDRPERPCTRHIPNLGAATPPSCRGRRILALHYANRLNRLDGPSAAGQWRHHLPRQRRRQQLVAGPPGEAGLQKSEEAQGPMSAYLSTPAD